MWSSFEYARFSNILWVVEEFVAVIYVNKDTFAILQREAEIKFG